MTHIEQLHLEAINDSKFKATYSPIPQIKESMLVKQSAEITEQIACEFQEWINSFCYIDWDVQDKMYYEVPSGKAIYDVKELFQEYLKSKENDISK